MPSAPVPSHHSIVSSKIPIVQVSHIPSASSFYASITQPLGIRYLAYSSSPPSSPTKSLVHPAFPPPIQPHVLHYGFPPSSNTSHPVTLFTLAPSPAPHLTTLSFAAPSPSAVQDFYHIGCLAGNYTGPNDPNGDFFITKSDAEVLATISDPDGNMLQARWVERSLVPSPQRARDVAEYEPPKESRRVLDWQRDVAIKSSSASSTSSGSGARQREKAPATPTRLVRRDTYPLAPRPREEESVVAGSGSQWVPGVSNGTLFGTLLGAAAGAAVAYAMVKGDSTPRDERPESSPRQANYSDPRADNPQGQWDRQSTGITQRSQHLEEDAHILATVQNVLTTVRAASGPRYLVRHNTIAGGEFESQRNRERDFEQVEVARSRVSSGNGSKTRSIREAPEERSTVISRRVQEDDDSRSRVTKASTPGTEMSTAKSKTKSRSGDSHVSTRSKAKSSVSSSTVTAKPSSKSATKQPSASTVVTDSGGKKRSSRKSSEVGSRSSRDKDGDGECEKRSPSRKHSIVSARHIPLPISEAGTGVTARLIPLPESEVGSYASLRSDRTVREGDRERHRHSKHEGSESGRRKHRSSRHSEVSARMVPLPESCINRGESDDESVAPSESVSCVGMRGQRDWEWERNREKAEWEARERLKGRF